ncbi:UNVERIFIED_CONTAM: hypothetical protein GTU68_032764 [Idotea baltica]|nr:hypothetical protein [Idotea baltica]
MAKAGANIAFSYRSSEEKANAFVEELTLLGVKAIAYKSDASNFEQAETLVKQVLEEFGSLEILVNNAGITLIHTNLKSVFNLTKQVMRPMMKQKGGSIINISSIVGMRGQAGQANYAASKAGIIGFSKSIAQEMGSRNIRCNVIAPGFIQTDMTAELSTDDFIKNIPLQRLGSGEEVADVAVFLASDMSRYITGQTVSVCGGLNV